MQENLRADRYASRAVRFFESRSGSSHRYDEIRQRFYSTKVHMPIGELASTTNSKLRAKK